MSQPTASAPASKPNRPYCPSTWLKPYLTPYYFTVAAVLGAVTAGFILLITVLLIIATNFNVLGAVE